MDSDRKCRFSELGNEPTCRDCGGIVVHMSGCEFCLSCGLSRCEG